MRLTWWCSCSSWCGRCRHSSAGGSPRARGAACAGGWSSASCSGRWPCSSTPVSRPLPAGDRGVSAVRQAARGPRGGLSLLPVSIPLGRRDDHACAHRRGLPPRAAERDGSRVRNPLRRRDPVARAAPRGRLSPRAAGPGERVRAASGSGGGHRDRGADAGCRARRPWAGQPARIQAEEKPSGLRPRWPGRPGLHRIPGLGDDERERSRGTVRVPTRASVMKTWGGVLPPHLSPPPTCWRRRRLAPGPSPPPRAPRPRP